MRSWRWAVAKRPRPLTLEASTPDECELNKYGAPTAYRQLSSETKHTHKPLVLNCATCTHSLCSRSLPQQSPQRPLNMGFRSFFGLVGGFKANIKVFGMSFGDQGGIGQPGVTGKAAAWALGGLLCRFVLQDGTTLWHDRLCGDPFNHRGTSTAIS